MALYFPGDIEIVDSVIEKTFNVKEKKKFPQETTARNEMKLIYEKRFSGYAAKHYRVCMNGNDRYAKEYKIEIQVASVLMHAWSEVEHDLIYKPSQGSLSKEELMILDEINGLVIAGNIALERLQDAGADRVAEGNYEFKNHYDLSLFITLELGVKEILDSKGTFYFLEKINKTSRENVKKILDASKIAQEKNSQNLHSLEPDQVATINILLSAAEIYPNDVIDAILDGLIPINIKTLRSQLCLVSMGHTREYPALLSCIAIIMKMFPDFSKTESPEKMTVITESMAELALEVDTCKMTYKEAAEALTHVGKTFLLINDGNLSRQKLSSILEKSRELIKYIKLKVKAKDI